MSEKFAVVKIKGQQFLVREKDEISVGRLGKDKPEAEVLLVADGKKIKVGTPTVKGAKVTFKVLKEEEKGKKLYVVTYKAKSRYRKKKGFRPVFSRLQVLKITG